MCRIEIFITGDPDPVNGFIRSRFHGTAGIGCRKPVETGTGIISGYPESQIDGILIEVERVRVNLCKLNVPGCCICNLITFPVHGNELIPVRERPAFIVFTGKDTRQGCKQCQQEQGGYSFVHFVKFSWNGLIEKGGLPDYRFTRNRQLKVHRRIDLFRKISDQERQIRFEVLVNEEKQLL